MDLFNYGKEPLKINKPIRLIELFAGIGSQAKALKRLGANFEHYRICEFDKYAIASYNAVYGTNFETSDITQISANDLGIVDTDKYCYITTYSFPCQDLSLAGQQKLMAKGSGTRSSLLWEVERLLNECTELPQILLMENVTQVHGKKNKEHFDKWIAFLESKGYSNYWKDLNAKNFGIPQNRNRTFMVSVLGDYIYEFPKEFPLELRLKDMLDDEVEEKYYLSKKMFDYAFNIKKEAKGIGFSDGVDSSYVNPDIAKTIGCRSAAFQRSGTTNYVTDAFDGPLKVSELKDLLSTDTDKVMQIGNLMPSKTRKNPNQGRLYDKEGLSPTLSAMQGGNRQPFIIDEPVALDEQNRYIRKDGCVGTLTTDGSSPKHNNRVIESDLRIRKLTPKECFRLMGFTDEDFAKAEAVNSNTQLYKQAGNSIVVNVLEEIFKQML